MNGIHANGWKVGMTVCVVIDLNVRGEPRPRQEEVTKIGRRWITVEGGKRFDADTLQIDGRGYSSPGRVYIDEADYRETTLLSKQWRSFRDALPYDPPKGLTLNRLNDIKKLIPLQSDEDTQ